MSTFPQTFGVRLCHARLALGWTQQRLATESGVDQRTISAYENGVNEPLLSNAVALAAALGVSLDALTAPAMAGTLIGEPGEQP